MFSDLAAAKPRGRGGGIVNAPVLSFTPRGELEPLTNIEAFVLLCRNSEVLDAKQQFDKNAWDVGYRKGRNEIIRLVFSTLEAARESKYEPSLPHPFLDFAKAVLIYLADKRPLTNYGQRIAALRCLEAALRESGKGSRPTAVDEIVLDSAVELAKQTFVPGVAYRVAGQLRIIAELMRTKEFIPLRQRWTHGLKKPAERNSRISKESMTARQEKLPSAATLRALGVIFYDAIEPGDVFISSVTGLLLCAPERINEVLRLRRNCIVEGDGEYRGKLGLRWSGSKGAENTTKWLPTEMAPIARKALEKIIKVTALAQTVAAWYTTNPGELYLHESAAHLRNKSVLTVDELALILFGDETAIRPAYLWARKSNNLSNHWLGGRRVGYRFEDVERAVLAMLPETFPYVPGAPELLCHESVALMRTNEMHLQRPTYWCMFNCVSYDMVISRFGAPGKGLRSIFERFGFTEDDGSAISLRSHSLRHYLNMLAQTGGLSSTEIAIFSGRKDVKQNRAYDHMTSDEVQAPIGQALKSGFTSELEPILGARRNLVTRSEFEGLGLTAAHTTQYGWCEHDFASEPCQMYRDCVNCQEQECIKGEAQKEANLRMLKSETEFLLEQAREALSEEEYGADTWVKHQTVTLERVNALLAILEDPAVPVGARIRLDVNNAPLITTDNVHPVRFVPPTGRKAIV